MSENTSTLLKVRDPATLRTFRRLVQNGKVDVNIVVLLLALICHLRSWCSHVQLVLEAQQ